MGEQWEGKGYLKYYVLLLHPKNHTENTVCRMKPIQNENSLNLKKVPKGSKIIFV